MLLSCGDGPQVTAQLDAADSLSAVQPDSALILLQGQQDNAHSWSKAQRMRHALLSARAMNKAYVPFTSDSILKDVASYYDSHGTPNERMEAHYLLGCAYRDLGEAPAAISAWQDAIDCGHTTAHNCDQYLLSRVYSQMADVFYRQGLMYDNLNYIDKALSHCCHNQDTLATIMLTAQKMNAYDRLGCRDSVISIARHIYNKYYTKGYSQLSATSFALPVSSMLNEGLVKEAGDFLKIYEMESGYFDSDGNVSQGRESYYHLKGRYFLALNKRDSAELYFRKGLLQGHDFINQSMAAYALSCLFQDACQPDSAAKYALYGYRMNDSVYAQMAMEEVERVKGLYDYSRQEAAARKAQGEADRANKKFVGMSLLLVAAIITAGIVVRKIKKKRKREAEQYKKQREKLEEILEELAYLRSYQMAYDDLQKILCDKEDLYQSEIGVVKSHEADLKILVREKEIEIENLCEQIGKLNRERHHEVAVALAERELTATAAYKLLKTKAQRGKLLTQQEWDALEREIFTKLTSFSALINSGTPPLNKKELRACMLFRLHVSPASVGCILNISPSAVTRLSKQILYKLFKAEGATKELATRLEQYS